MDYDQNRRQPEDRIGCFDDERASHPAAVVLRSHVRKPNTLVQLERKIPFRRELLPRARAFLDGKIVAAT